MSRSVRLIVGIIIGLVIVGGAAYAYVMLSGGDGTPSEEITAPTLAVNVQPTAEATEAPAASTPEATAENTQEAAAASTTEAETEATEAPAASTPEATAENTQEAAVASTTEAETEATEAPAASTPETAASSSGAGLVVFNIVSEESSVSFTLTEDLMGRPTTVVGTTDQVAGQIAVDFSDPQASQVGEIRINARTLRTDQENRNRAIRSQILQSAQDQYEFISFVPTAISGLPDTITVGEAVTFQITGDLTIRDITQSVTFETTVTPVSETELTGTATTTVQRGDFQLTIPSVPSVANVSEAVDLQIDFVAEAA